MKKGLFFTCISVISLLIIGYGCGSPDAVRLSVDKSKYNAVVIMDFSLENAKVQENVDVEAFAKGLPEDFSVDVKSYIESMKFIDKVLLEKDAANVNSSEDFVVIEGRFTKITAGSTAARILVGLGAGSSTVGAEWVIKDGKTGDVLATYERNRHTSRGFRGIPAVESDAKYLAKDVATLLKRTIR